MNLRQFRTILLQVLLVPLLTLAVTATALYLQFRSANRAVDLIRRSDLRIAQAQAVGKLIIDEETGLRGYEATGDEHFLEPYQGVRPRVEAIFRSLEYTPGSMSPEGTPYHGIRELEDAYRAWHEGYADPLLAALTRGESTHDPARDLRGKQLMDHVRLELAAAIARAQERRTERVARWQGETHTTEIAVFALTLGTGAFIGLFCRNRLHTVSAAYRKSLTRLRQRNEENFQTQQRLMITLSSIGDGVIACDPHCRVELMNPVAEHLTGWPQAEARGRSITEVFPLINEETHQPMEDPVTKVKREDRIVLLANHAMLRRRDGREIPIADSGAPIRGQGGEMQGVVMVFRDVSAERRTQEALLAQERLASAGRLAATIAHEIHNPLDNVGGLLYLMRQGGTDDEMAEFLSTAQTELERVTEISRAMLGMHREATSPIAVDLRGVLRDVLLLMKRRIFESGVVMDADLPPAIVIQGYPAELKQVFTNLLSNAVDAAGKDGEVMVEVSRLTPTGGDTHGHVQVLVRDNGPGIPADVLAQLFTPFVTTKGEQGTGLGLWVSRGIVAKHGGVLELESSTDPAGHGTVARVTLPVSPPSRPEPVTDDTASRFASAPTPDGAGPMLR